MDCLARNLGLDIEALARSLAMNNDGRKPIQCLDVEDDTPEMKRENEEAANGSLLKMQKVNEIKNEESKEQEVMIKQEKDEFVKDSQHT